MSFLQDFPLILQALLAFPFGLIIGSFLNVVIYRVPRGESIAFPSSHCGSCGAAVKPYDNIPLLSYAILGGRCRDCRAKISPIYPTVELLTGVLFFLLAFKQGITALSMAEMLFGVVLIVLFFIDYRHQLLPNVVTYPAFLAVVLYAATGLPYPRNFGSSLLFSLPLIYKVVIGVVLLVVAALAFYGVDWLDQVLFNKYMEFDDEEDENNELSDVNEEQLIRQHDRVIFTTMILGGIAALVWGGVAYWNLRPESANPIWVTSAFENLYQASLGALVGGGIIWLLRALYFYTRGIGGMGLGDVKMMAIIGGFLGWPTAILVLIIGSVLGSLVGVLQVIFGRSQKGMKTKLPFGVFLAIGAIIGVFFGPAIVQWYIGFLPH